ncbi:Carboxymethylenebutenolidase [Paraburkholderia rhynchosiae]|uniref:Carboxymethylenebutenolidase n=1 Tax=Paraburkholderia rhynchosiae TaxID=487049 RepID=A0A2N7VJ36_9BURK|nr:hypothetical protein C0Z16_36675 [Paraburkholderia rhynchosiae]CAB3744751.1 Carboxymethylenebutenolidase [Paraburkholderia rhynchosiae]
MGPDLFWSAAPRARHPTVGQDDWDKADKLYEAYDLDKGAGDIATTAKAAHAFPCASGRVGPMGFRLGGLMTILIAVRTEVDAALSYCGGRTAVHLSEAVNVEAPVMVHVGEVDDYISRDAQQAIKTAFASRPEAATTGIACLRRPKIQPHVGIAPTEN